MFKKICLRGLIGFPLGISIGYVITIITSLIWGQGYYSPCVPIFIEMVGSEIVAVIIQTLLTGILGLSFAVSSIVWEMEEWSITKQTAIYFLITAISMFPIAYLTGWMEHSLLGFVIYFGVFVIIFVIIWIIQYFIWKEKIRKINQQIRKL